VLVDLLVAHLAHAQIDALSMGDSAGRRDGQSEGEHAAVPNDAAPGKAARRWVLTNHPITVTHVAALEWGVFRYRIDESQLPLFSNRADAEAWLRGELDATVYAK
jgi:hypothetical protein